MSEEELNKIEYILIVVREFAKHYGLTDKDAYIYISGHNGVSLMDEYYDVMHTQTFKDMVQTLASYCRKNGGYL